MSETPIYDRVRAVHNRIRVFDVSDPSGMFSVVGWYAQIDGVEYGNKVATLIRDKHGGTFRHTYAAAWANAYSTLAKRGLV